jgi:ABC-type multidrug transport system ATPase subunit
MNEPFNWHQPAGAPALIVKTRGTEQTLQAGLSYRVGRNPESDIVLDDPRVSWDHAVLQADGGAWFVEDRGSRNGTFADTRRIGRLEITGDCTLRFGDAADGPAVFCALSRPAQPVTPGQPVTPSKPGSSFSWSRVDVRPTAVMRAPVRTLRIGRADDNDIVLADLSVSRYHAQLRNLGGRYEIVDLGSHNGTFLNGEPVVSRATVTEQDIVGIGAATFRLVGDELREFIDKGDVSLVAQGLTVRMGSQVLLHQVSFPIGERSLVAVIGPSGAGKTTLLRALTGIQPANEGAVLYDNRDLYSHYAELRHRIGLVPQEDVIYDQLTPRRSLDYAAELRFPGDTSPEERHNRVQEVIDELKLMHTTKQQPEPAADTQAASLSGGQKKRVSIAVELLTKPSVLFLDEPTSSLDVELKEDVVDSMRELAKDGRTVIMVTHDLEYLDKCDRVLVLMPGGKMAFYGPSDDGLRYFGKTRWVEVYRAFRNEPERDWAGDFRRSPDYQQYVAIGLTGPSPESARTLTKPPPAPRSRLAQLSILSRRYAALIAADRSQLILLLALPILLGGLVRLNATGPGLGGHDNAKAETTLLFLVIIASLTGGFSSVRELIKEREMFRRERMAGLSAGAYLLSKVVVLGFIAALQAAVLVLVGVAGARSSVHGALLPVLPELILGVAALSVSSMALGLVVSAWVRSSEQTLVVLILLLMAQVMLSGGVLALGAGLKQLSYLAPARWGLASVASTVNLNVISPPGSTTDPLWAHKPSAWLLTIVMQVVLTAVFTLIALWRLIRISPGRARRPSHPRLPRRRAARASVRLDQKSLFRTGPAVTVRRDLTATRGEPGRAAAPFSPSRTPPGPGGSSPVRRPRPPARPTTPGCPATEPSGRSRCARAPGRRSTAAPAPARHGTRLSSRPAAPGRPGSARSRPGRPAARRRRAVRWPGLGTGSWCRTAARRPFPTAPRWRRSRGCPPAPR